MPSLAVVMTPFPHSIDIDGTLAAARAMMKEHNVHHLPVTSQGELVGSVSRRDLTVAVLNDTDDPPLGKVMQRNPFVAAIKTPLDQVVHEMSQRRIDAALVTRNGKLVGILTHTDVAKLLAQALRDQFPTPGDDEIA